MHLLTCVLAFAAALTALAPAVSAQDAPQLAAEEMLQALLPERVGPYERTEVSASPFINARGWEDERGTTLTGLYEAEGGQSLVVALSHFRRQRHRDELSTGWWAGRVDFGEASETTYLDYLTFEQADPLKVAVFVGETFEADAYQAEGEVPVEDLYAVLEAVDFEALEALDREYTLALRRASEPDVAATDAVTGVEGEVDCSTFNEDVRAETTEMMGVEEFVPWIHFLIDEQAATAEVNEDMVTFPKEGNAWLQCVRENDILWAPIGTYTFLLRVKDIWELPSRAVFRTERSGFTDVLMQGSIEMEAGEPERQPGGSEQ